MPKRKRAPNPDKKALRRVEQARGSYVKIEGRVGSLRTRLARAEQKLTMRAARLSEAEAALAARAAPAAPDEAVAPAIATTAALGTEKAHPAPATDELAAGAVSGVDNGATPKARARSRRAESTSDES